MHHRILFIWKYLLHFAGSYGRRGHGVHSPFVYDFIINVLKDNPEPKEKFGAIEKVRTNWIRSSEVVEVKDLGAGSRRSSNSTRRINEIALHAAKHPRFGRFFYRLVRHYRIDSVLELGTSLGVTARYFSVAEPANGVTTIEGSPSIAALASASMVAEGVNNVRVVTGDFDSHFERELARMKGAKLVYFDGNHRYAPTMKYYRTALSFAGPDDIFVFDDIHWSNEMERAWEEIRNSKEVACSIDLFFIGIVVFKKEFKEKLRFAIRF